MSLQIEVHPDTITCPDCGHDCDAMDCGDICICIEHAMDDADLDFDDEPEFFEDFDWRVEYSDGYDD